ncbi:MAG: amidohydrolase family protein [Solirubrobacterales bacterium]
MIVDCHTHVGERSHFSDEFVADLVRAWGAGANPARSLEQHWEAVAAVDRAIVLAFAAPRIGFDVPNEYVAAYVADHSEKLIGFASVDANDAEAVPALERAVDSGLRGLKLAPTYQGFDPLGPEALAVCEAAEQLGLPVIWHQGTTFVRSAELRWALPLQIDQVALRFPRLRIVIAHMGHPWIEDALVVVRKHPNVFADVSALHPRPWQLYTALVSAVEYGVGDKLLFGSDWPFVGLEDTFTGLRSANRFTEGTALPRIPDEVIEGIIVRPTLELLGLEPPETV